MTAARTVLPLAAMLALAGCYNPPAPGGGRASASASTLAACRHRADDVYLRQNRDEIYRADTYVGSTRDTPFSSSGLSGITSSGLSGQYARDNLEQACLNSSSGPGGDSADPATVIAPGITTPSTGTSGPGPRVSPVTR